MITKENNFCDFLFAFKDNTLQKGQLSKAILSCPSKVDSLMQLTKKKC